VNWPGAFLACAVLKAESEENTTAHGKLTQKWNFLHPLQISNLIEVSFLKQYWHCLPIVGSEDMICLMEDISWGERKVHSISNRQGIYMPIEWGV